MMELGLQGPCFPLPQPFLTRSNDKRGKVKSGEFSEPSKSVSKRLNFNVFRDEGTL